jgi:hypothetical protein
MTLDVIDCRGLAPGVVELAVLVSSPAGIICPDDLVLAPSARL